MRFGLVNFANPDMVGHTGVIPAAVEAVRDGRPLPRRGWSRRSTARGGVCLVTADHGNAELMLNADGSPNTAHTTNPVPLIATRPGLRLRDGGRLADVAPTVLALLGVDQPDAMTRHARWSSSAEPVVEDGTGRHRHPCGRMSILAVVLVTNASPLGPSAA